MGNYKQTSGSGGKYQQVQVQGEMITRQEVHGEF
jgi:hypothetical protein